MNWLSKRRFHCRSSSSQVCGASGFTSQKGLTEGSMLGENRFAAAVQKEEVVECLSRPHLNALLKGISVHSGLHGKSSAKAPLDTQVGRVGQLWRPGTHQAWCGQTAGCLHAPSRELHPQAGGLISSQRLPWLPISWPTAQFHLLAQILETQVPL